MVKITSVQKGSPADIADIRPGDYLININGHPISDVLDYRYYMTEKRLTLTIHRGEKLFDIKLKKEQYEDTGLDFSTYLMDEKHSCRNKCIFCFIDQLPEGMRKTLYFKDDDSRMSFLTGSYITLTNLSETDVERIIEMKISPINISVHTTDPELRVKMMKNPNAGKSLELLDKFAKGGIEMNAQIVLCRGINDGENLERSMNDLKAYFPQIRSVSVVPSGLTRYREKLFPLTPYTPQECSDIIEQVTRFGDKCKEETGIRMFYPGDELFIKAGIPLPTADFYDGYPQIENGVGMITSMGDEFADELDFIEDYDLEKERNISIATGEAAYNFISSIAQTLCKYAKNTKINVYKITNDFFGENITVAGLITGGDLIAQLKDKELGDTLYIPSVMLRYENDLFLDDVSIETAEKELEVKLETVNNSGFEFIEKLLS